MQTFRQPQKFPVSPFIEKSRPLPTTSDPDPSALAISPGHESMVSPLPPPEKPNLFQHLLEKSRGNLKQP